MTAAQWAADRLTRIIASEGFEATRYFDSLGVPTIGVGWNMQRPDTESALVAIGIASPGDRNDLFAGRSSLRTSQVYALLAIAVQPLDDECRSLLEDDHYDRLGDARRFAFSDLCYNLGAGELASWRHFLGYVNAGVHASKTADPDGEHLAFAAAVSDLLSTAYAAQVGARAKRNAAMLGDDGYVDPHAFE